MKKIFVSIALTVSLTSVLFLSNCSKNETTPKEVSKIEQYNKAFAEMGEYHNQSLDFVAANGNIANMSRKERFDLVQKFLGSSSSWKETERIGNELNMVTEGKISTRVMLSTSKNTQFSNDFLSLTDILEGILNQAKVAASQGDATTPEHFNANIDLLIEDTYDKFDVQFDEESETANEFGLFVAQCFLAKSTYQYWYEANIDPENPWHNYLQNDSGAKGIWRWIKVAGADVWGFVSSGEVSISGDGSVSVKFKIDEAVEAASKQSASVQ